MKKFIVVLSIFYIMISFIGCKKNVSDMSHKDDKVSKSDQGTPVFSDINLQAVVKTDTLLFNDYTCIQGTPLIVGESLLLIGEGENLYICVYKQTKGYINKDSVNIIDQNQDNNLNNNGFVFKKQVVENVKEYVITSTNTIKTQTLAPPPKTLYTTGKMSDEGLSNSLLKALNNERTKRSLPIFNVNKDIKEKAEYYCDIFVSKNNTYDIKGYSIQTSGKFTTKGKEAQIAKAIISNFEGFVNKNITKIGVAVIEANTGGYYYCVLAK